MIYCMSALSLHMELVYRFCRWTINDLPSKIKKMFLNSFKAVRHGSFTLVHSVVNKIW